MEQEKPSQDLIIPSPTLVDPPHHDYPRPFPKPPKKRRGPMYFIRVALFMIKSRSSDKSKGFSDSGGPKSLWRKLVGSVRPLHLQIQQVAESEAKRPVPPALIHQSPAHTEFSEDAMFSPMAGSSTPSASNTPYASAVGLNEMVQENEKEKEEEAEAVEDADYARDDGDGDKMIDAKAEEFIANFYNEMRLQRRDSMNERSLR